jgi:hypothetical protein
MKLVNPGEEASAPSPVAIRLPHLPTRETPERETQSAPVPLDDHDSEEQEIEQMFRAKLMDLRRLPRHLRGAALRAAREWRLDALKALRDKRARERRARLAMAQGQQPAPK